MNASERSLLHYEVLIAIQKLNSLDEIKKLFISNFHEIGLKDVNFIDKDTQPKDSDYHLSPLSKKYSIIFQKKYGEKFNKTEKSFLNKVTKSISLFALHIINIKEATELKDQWENTFNSISDPICLVSSDGKLINANKAFFIQINKDNKVIGKNALEAFFNRRLREIKYPLINQQKLISYPNQKKIFEVSIQATSKKQPSISLILFRDVTEEQQLEGQVLESTKMTELGTIGSSIAHELNNPLGGILSFVQLIKMGLDKNSPIYDDIIEMEETAIHCKDTVKRLLDFSRKYDHTDFQNISLSDAINESLQLSKIFLDPHGVKINLKNEVKSDIIFGQKNLLVQAFNNVIQNSDEALVEKMTAEPGVSPVIDIHIFKEDNLLKAKFTDNGIGIAQEDINQVFNPLFTTKNNEKNPGLGLTIAYKVSHEHQSRLEIFSHPKIETSVIFSFKSLD